MENTLDTQLAEPVDQQPTSLADDLAAAFDSHAGGDDASVTAQDVAQTQQIGNSQQAAQPVEAPQHWAPQHREIFARSTPEQQQFLLERHRAMEGDYTRRQQENAEYRRQYERQIQFAEQANQIWSPVAQQFAHQGLDPFQVQRMAAAWVQSLNQDPKGSILRLAQEFGIDPAQLMEQQEYVDPMQQQLTTTQQRVEQLQQALQQRDQYQQQQEQMAQVRALADRTAQEVSVELDALVGTKDANGAPAFPHLEAVRNEMSAILNARDGSGAPLIPFSGNFQQDLTLAYQRALAMRPDLVAAPKGQRPGDRIRTARLAAQALSSGGGGQQRPATWEDAARMAFDMHSP